MDRPDVRSGLRYLVWLARCQPRRAFAASLLGATWMVTLALSPYLVSRAVDDGLTPGDAGATRRWAAALALLAVATAVLSIGRHRTMSRIRVDASQRSHRAIGAHLARLGAEAQNRVAAGEVATVGTVDVVAASASLTVMGPGVGAVVAYVLVGVLIARSSPLLAVMVLVGVPLVVLAVAPILRRVRAAQESQRRAQAAVSARLVDAVEGLRVVQALGARQRTADAHAEESAGLRQAGDRVGDVSSWVDALGTGLPALVAAIVVWIGARLALAEELTIGELAALGGYVAMLVIPVSVLIEGADQITRGLVGAGRIVAVLRVEPTVDPDASGGPGPAGPAPLVDPSTGVEIEPGLLTAVVDPSGAARSLVERLGGLVPSDVTWGGEPLSAVAHSHLRRRIVVGEGGGHLFAGPLATVVSGAEDRPAEDVRWALEVAAAADLLEPDGDVARSGLAPGGRNLSGGQRQRVRLARAVAAHPEVLLALDPTSSLDTTTESIVGRQLRQARRGTATAVSTTSPLLLAVADRVLLVVDGEVVATGAHTDLWARSSAYRAVVSSRGRRRGARCGRDAVSHGFDPRRALLPVASPGETRRALRAVVGQHRRALAWSAVLAVLAAATVAPGPWLLGRMVDEVRQDSGAATIDRFGAALVVVALAQVLLARAARRSAVCCGESIQDGIRRQLLGRILDLPPTLVERVGSGDLIARGTADVATIGVTLRDAIPAVVVALLQIVVLLVATVVVHPLLGACGVAGVVAAQVAFGWYRRRAPAAYIEQGASASAMAEHLAEDFAGARTVAAVGLGGRRHRSRTLVLTTALAAQERTLRLRSVLFPAVDVAIGLPMALVLAVGGVLVGDGRASVGDVVAAMGAMQLLAPPAATVLAWVEQLQSSGASLSRVEGLAQVTGAADGALRPVAGPPVAPVLVARGVSFAYGNRDVVHEVDLVVPAGERLAIVGPSGAGKTTLCHLLAGAELPDRGSVNIGGAPVGIGGSARAPAVLVTQEQHLFVGSLGDNLRLGAPDAADEDLWSALDLVEAGWARGLAEGLDADLGADGEVAGSRLQQVALARAVLARPAVLLLDEATAQLQPARAWRVERAVAAALPGSTVVSVAHRLSSAEDAGRVAVMEHGRIIEVGPHHRLVAADGLYACLWEAWGSAVTDAPADP